MFKQRIVSFGAEFKTERMKFEDGSALILPGNKLENTDRIEERNLFYCQYLNLQESSIVDLCTVNLGNLRMLSIEKTKICHIDTSTLINLIYLHIADTNIETVDTSQLI